MLTIHERAAKSIARHSVVEFDPYPDTLSVYFPRARLAYRDWERLCSIYGDQPHRVSNREIGFLIVGFQSPQPDLLRELTRLCEHYGGHLRSLDIALDARQDEAMTIEEQHRWIREHILLKHRAAQRIEQIENEDGTTGDYFCRKGAPRNLVLYWGLPGKLDPLSELYAHVDLRLGRRAIRSINIGQIEHLDPRLLILRHIRFVEFSRKAFERKTFKKIAREHGAMQAEAQMARLKRHGQIEFAQRVHDQSLIKLRDNNGLVILPNAFAWGAQRRNMKMPIAVEDRNTNVRMCRL